jgi:2-aminoethylphosphonate dioxygenase
MTYTIPQDQLESFHKNGYLVVKRSDHQLFTAQEIQQWCKEVESLPNEKGKWMFYNEINSKGVKQPLRVEKFIDYHAKFNDLTRGEGFGSMLTQLTGQKMHVFKDKINFKYVNGNGFGAHTDAPAYTHVGDIRHLTINVAIDEATVENGCLEVVPGSHKMDVELEDNHISKKWENEHEWDLVPLEAGDLLFFGSYFAHRSGPNRSDKSRRAAYVTYHSSPEGDALRETYYAHRRIHFPPEDEREAGKDYSEGYKTYAFAAPFARGDAVTTN